MLERLHIKNFALITDIQIEFSPEMNVLTGETGAGKSMIIDALRFVLGERLDSVRGVQAGSSVEAVFALSGELAGKEELAAYLSDGDALLIFRRDAQADGKTRSWINSRSVNNSALKSAGAFLIDIHGQYDHQQLLDASTHLQIIDRYAKNEELRASYETVYSRYAGLVRRLEELNELEEGREREADLLKYQIEEIERAQLEDGEEEELKLEQIRMANSEKLFELSERALNALDADDISVSGLLSGAFRDINALARLDQSLNQLKGDFENAQLAMEEVIRSLREYKETLSYDPERLSETEKRLDLIELLKRKYGSTIERIKEFLAQSKAKYDQISNRALYEKETAAEIEKIMPELKDLSGRLSERRRRAAAALKRVIEQELKDLQLAHARFECQIGETDFGSSGRDTIEFLISVNAGQPMLPLRKMVSAGEVSRIMLALKKALMKADPVPTLIFDEIDANIGGRLGDVTGEKLREISRERQILLITHLPQIASFADRHFKVTKTVRGGKTFAEYVTLEGQVRVQELAQMMSGAKESLISQKHAEEMLARNRS